MAAMPFSLGLMFTFDEFILFTHLSDKSQTYVRVQGFLNQGKKASGGSFTVVDGVFSTHALFLTGWE